jgi:alpha-beta hydrolase superfamily lysophospholipase
MTLMRFAVAMATTLVAALAVVILALSWARPTLEPWHTSRLSEEFTAAKAGAIRSFDDYRNLEDRLFRELDREVYAHVETGPAYALFRYSAGSAADPRTRERDWNRSFEVIPEDPVAGVLLLHGMSDSPYSLRALARALAARRHHVINLRMPGHGTAPSALRSVTAPDMIAAVRVAMRHLSSQLGPRPVHIVGFSTGAALALDYALDSIDGEVSPAPASLVLISPAVRIHATAGLARFKNALSVLPGLAGLAYTQVLPELDPFRFNSFATNAGDVVHRLTRSVQQRIPKRAATPEPRLPPILVFKSAVDSTVTTEAVVDDLLGRLSPGRHELVLFDINRVAWKSRLMVADPGPLTRRLMDDAGLPFAVTFITNESPKSASVVALHKSALSGAPLEPEPLGLEWPRGVVSLSHIALPFPPDDPLYGRLPPENEGVLFLGEMALRGERGLLRVPTDWLLRMRYNPFYEVVEQRALAWFEQRSRQRR